MQQTPKRQVEHYLGDQPVLESAEEALDSAFSLWKCSQDEFYSQFLKPFTWTGRVKSGRITCFGLWKSVKYEEVSPESLSVPEARTGLGWYFEFYNAGRPLEPEEGNDAGPVL